MHKIIHFIILIFELIILPCYSVSQSNKLSENNVLNENGQLVSFNGQYTAKLQTDGNFVIYVRTTVYIFFKDRNYKIKSNAVRNIYEIFYTNVIYSK